MKSVDEPIDWHYWRNMREVELWEACLLSLNINPDIMQRDRDGWMAGAHDIPHFEQGSFPNSQAGNDYRKRLSLLRNNASKREFFSPGKLNILSPNLCGVKLPEFASWAMHIELSIPSELESIARSLETLVPKNATLEDKPLSTKERNTLLSIIAVLCKEAKMDYTKSSKIAGLIQKTADDMGISIGETTIEEHLKKIPDALRTRMK